MKKISLLFLALITISIFHACNGSDEKSKPESVNSTDSIVAKGIIYPWLGNTLDSLCLDGTGVGNFLIDSAVADTMIKHFNLRYGKYANGSKIEAIIRDYWLDSCTIYSVSDFLKSAPDKYDGARIHLAASTITEGSYAKPYQNKTMLFIYPTGKSAAGHADSTHLLIPFKGCITTSPYLESFSSASSKVSVFERVYHNNSPSPKDPAQYSFSKGIWIDACVFNFLATLIKASNGTLDGIRVHTAAYLGNETKLPLGATAKQSSTIIMVPTSPGPGGLHKDNWSVAQGLIMLITKIKTTTGVGFNHGELCPQSCN